MTVRIHYGSSSYHEETIIRETDEGSLDKPISIVMTHDRLH